MAAKAAAATTAGKKRHAGDAGLLAASKAAEVEYWKAKAEGVIKELKLIQIQKAKVAKINAQRVASEVNIVLTTLVLYAGDYTADLGKLGVFRSRELDAFLGGAGADTRVGGVAAAIAKDRVLLGKVRQLASTSPTNRKEGDSAAAAAAGNVSVSGIMRDVMRHAANARGDGGGGGGGGGGDPHTVVTEVEFVTTAKRGVVYHSFHTLTDVAVLPAAERHANVVSVLLTTALVRSFAVRGGMWVKAVAEARAQAAMRLIHLVGMLPEGAATRGGVRLAAYALAADAVTFRVVCLEIVWVSDKFGTQVPTLRFNLSSVLPLWSAGMVAYANRARGWSVMIPTRGGELDAAHPPAGLVALTNLLLAERDELGARAYSLPTLKFTDPTKAAVAVDTPAPATWSHLGSGGVSEVYGVATDTRGFVVVKVSRHPGEVWHGLNNESAMYERVGGGDTCPAIPTLQATSRISGGADSASIVTALVLHPGARIAATSPVLGALSTSPTRLLDALLATYSVVVALVHAHACGIAHRDVRVHHVVWIIWQTPPALVTPDAVQRAIAAAEAGGDPTPFIPVRAQLVDWGNAEEVDDAGVDLDITALWSVLLPCLVTSAPGLSLPPTTAVSSCATLATTRVDRWPLDRVAGLADHLPGWAPTLAELSAATTAMAALVAVLRLLQLTVAVGTGGASSGTTADAPPRRAGPRRAAATAAAAAIKAELQGIAPK